MDISTGHLTNGAVELLDDETLPFETLKYKYGWIVSTTNMMSADIRFGEQVVKDMIAVPVGPEMRLVVVGALS